MRVDAEAKGGKGFGHVGNIIHIALVVEANEDPGLGELESVQGEQAQEVGIKVTIVIIIICNKKKLV